MPSKDCDEQVSYADGPGTNLPGLSASMPLTAAAMSHHPHCTRAVYFLQAAGVPHRSSNEGRYS